LLLARADSILAWNLVRRLCPVLRSARIASPDRPRHTRILSFLERISSVEFHPGDIDGVIWKPLKKYHDARGWLLELYREDELPEEFHPVMAYISLTEPGIARGPHEHVDQADYFCFIGPSNFKMYLWDNRPTSKTYRAIQTDIVGIDKPMALVVPKGVVHGYKNVGAEQGVVLNCANRLYKGPGKKEPVDEIRHEEAHGSIFKMD
jgi:dTDP-4-dehydrorhamnose 3,5-epimerase